MAQRGQSKIYDQYGSMTSSELKKLLENLRYQRLRERYSFGVENLMQNNKAQGGRIGYANGGGLTEYEVSRLGQLGYNTKGGTVLEPFGGLEVLRDILKVNNYAQGGDVSSEGDMMNLGGNEMDLRGGGFVPLGAKEKADDVPARLSKNEFVFTADAVRAAGGGSVDKGAEKMYNTMKRLEGVMA
jgi:hypothetical protein